MRILLAFSLTLAAMSTASVAQDNGDYRGQIEIAADAVTSAQTCSQIGYQVDFDGIAQFSTQAREAALSDGVETEVYDRLFNERITRKYDWLQQRFVRASRMVEDSENRARHKRFWMKRCERLSDNALVSSLFMKTLS